jgi:hypothetical protein
MAQRLTTSSINTNIPGAYPEVTVKSTPVGITNTGDIVIIGEAEGGQDYTQEVLADNFFTATQLDRVTAKYLRGPIVDAMSALVSPSNDSNIQGSAGRVYIVKTNGGTQASLAIDGATAGSYGTLTDKNYGVDGNKYYYQITQSVDEAVPTVTGSDADFGVPSAFNGASFSLFVNGVESVISIGIDVADIATLVSEIQADAPANIDVSNDGDKLIISIVADTATQNDKGYGQSFEISGAAAIFGLADNIYTTSAEPEVQLEIKRQDTNTNESFLAEAEVALTIGYSNGDATVTIDNGQISTSTPGGLDDFSIALSDFTTVQDLAAFIASKANYSASAIPSSNNLNPENLDEVAAIGIHSTDGEEPGRIKKGAYNTARAFANSAVVDFAATATAGLPDSDQPVSYLQGGAKGATLASDIVNAIPALEGIKVNFVLPLFSRDYTEDIADGLTDSGSTYTIDAINFAIKSHVLQMSTIKIKRNRVAMLSKWGEYADIKTHAQTLASYRCNVCIQKSSQVNSLGEIVEYLPWHTAAIATGMQSAGFYRSLTNKFANIISFKDPSGFDSGNIGSTEDAIDAGLLFLQKETAGNKWVVDQTTYGFDSNFVYNSLQATYMADVLAIQLADSLQNSFVGRSLADITSATVQAFIAKKMDEYKRLKIIGASDDAPLGYKNVKVSINGPIVNVKLEAKLATAILFIPIQLELSQIQSSSEA